ncbi:MAG: hypothetical protein L0G87_06870 [Renibacterium salmoninarum]|nr:hypothetical protein [Renibacterium salmoninarum]
MATITGDLSKSAQVRPKRALWIFIGTIAASVAGLAIPIASLATVALGIAAALLIRKAKPGSARGLLIASVAIAILSLSLVASFTAAWYLTTS